MAPVKVDPAKVREFEDAKSFYEWLGEHHDKEHELWIKIHKGWIPARSATVQANRISTSLPSSERKASTGDL